jgi:hypothetical protein
MIMEGKKKKCWSKTSFVWGFWKLKSYLNASVIKYSLGKQTSSNLTGIGRETKRN